MCLLSEGAKNSLSDNYDFQFPDTIIEAQVKKMIKSDKDIPFQLILDQKSER